MPRKRAHSISLGGVTNLSVLAPIKAGFVDSFEPITYLKRLERLLDALHAGRRNVNESELLPPVFPDSIGRFGMIQSFRYAIVPPDRLGTDDPNARSLLSLNVTFDGGWDPYMRVIYRDIGPLLDALFCHCDTDYPGSRTGSFEDYCRWVRENEVEGGIFYTDSAISVSDREYLKETARLQRDSASADKPIAQYALPSEKQQEQKAIQAALANPLQSLALPLRTLKGFYRLSTFFPRNAADEHGILVRFAHSVLRDFKQVIEHPGLRKVPQWQAVEAVMADELRWFASPQVPPARPDRRDYDAAALQHMVLNPGSKTTHGCIAMLAVDEPEKALAQLRRLAKRCGPKGDAPLHHVALTYSGLQALGFTPERLEMLPQVFVEGMEARCGVLGDVRTNHPDRWRRPERHGGKPGERVDLGAVHVVVVLRVADPKQQGIGLNPKLDAALRALHGGRTGMTLLSVQPTEIRRDSQQRVTGHFGFVDGISQPRIVSGRAPAQRSDEVRPGELLLGFANDRDDGPYPPYPDLLLDDASFLVMRKLRQRVDRLKARFGENWSKDPVLERMMGRKADGGALVPTGAGGPNDFNYDRDPDGTACPFQSHVRRANPRDGRAYTPRLLRRGMSYTDPDGSVGLVFMAYCASIAEQFEIIQRWLSGGNSSGVGSAQADPFLAVPDPEDPNRTFRYVDASGAVQRVALGKDPFVELEWGLYLFVPSLQALSKLSELRGLPAAERAREARRALLVPAAEAPLDEWRRRLEHDDRSAETWERVREEHGGELHAPPYGTLLGTSERILPVLQDDGRHFSVEGYAQRMDASLGRNFLGMDPHTGHDAQAPHVNRVIQDVDEPTAFAKALPIVRTALGQLLPYEGTGGPSTRYSVDLVSLSDAVLAGLCTVWFGLPADPLMIRGGRVDDASGPPRCPGHVLSPSRYVFTPHPSPSVIETGQDQGELVLEAVRKMFEQGLPTGELTPRICAGLSHIPPAERQDVIERTIAGMLLGFPPTVQGNFLRTLETWIHEQTLWTLQSALAAQAATPASDFARAEAALRRPLLDTMRRRPVPEMLWRCPVENGKPNLDPAKKVVLGIASALKEQSVDDVMMFGGSRDPGPYQTVHACPGYGMAVGVMLALLVGLMEAGTLRPTGSPVLLMLTRS